MVVAACQRIAILNPHVEASMMDIALFPQLKKEFKIMSVPAVIKNNDKLLFGSKTIDEILDFIGRIKRTASRISVKLFFLSS